MEYRISTLTGDVISLIDAPVLIRRTNKGCKERVWRQRLRLELRVELAAQNPRMTPVSHVCDEFFVGENTENDQAVFRKSLLKLPIEFVAMPVSLENHRSVVDAVGQ